MKRIIELSILLSVLIGNLLLTNCSTTRSVSDTTEKMNQVVPDDRYGSKLIGKSNRVALLQEPFSEWYKQNYEAYKVNSVIADKVTKREKDVRILAFMGTWCRDSRIQVPKFYKVMDQLEIQETAIEMIQVDYTPEAYKQSPGKQEKGLNIHRVPTFIFYREGEEIGRIVETPSTTMETDIVQILKGIPSSPNYQVVSRIHHEFENVGVKSFVEKEKKWINYIRYYAKNSGEVNTFGYVLLGQDRVSDAITLFKLNAAAFPHVTNVWDSLAEAYVAAGNSKEAIANYNKVLELEPANEVALEAIKNLKETTKM